MCDPPKVGSQPAARSGNFATINPEHMNGALLLLICSTLALTFYAVAPCTGVGLGGCRGDLDPQIGRHVQKMGSRLHKMPLRLQRIGSQLHKIHTHLQKRRSRVQKFRSQVHTQQLQVQRRNSRLQNKPLQLQKNGSHMQKKPLHLHEMIAQLQQG